MLMMWLLLTRSTWLSSLVTTSLSQDSYLTLPCLFARSSFPHLPPLLIMWLSQMLLLPSHCPATKFLPAGGHWVWDAKAAP
jgi:hypothetical protein